jgi:hypothetical protein
MEQSSAASPDSESATPIPLVNESTLMRQTLAARAGKARSGYGFEVVPTRVEANDLELLQRITQSGLTRRRWKERKARASRVRSRPSVGQGLAPVVSSHADHEGRLGDLAGLLR